MAAFDFFKGSSPLGGHTRVRKFPIKSSNSTFYYGNPLIYSSGTLDLAASNPTAASVVGISLSGSVDANGSSYLATNGVMLPVAVKTMEDEWICHNWVASGGTSGTGVAPTVAAAVGATAGFYYGTFTLSATDVRATVQGLTTVATTWAIDATAAVTVKHVEVVRVLDSSLRDITVSGGTGEYVAFRWLNVAQ